MVYNIRYSQQTFGIFRANLCCSEKYFPGVTFIMSNTLGIICEIIVLIFNILIYMELTVPRKDTKATRSIMYIGSALILSLFFVCTYFLKIPEALASFVCVTLPSFTLFFLLSKYRDC